MDLALRSGAAIGMAPRRGVHRIVVDIVRNMCHLTTVEIERERSMDEENPRQRLTEFARSARDKRILERLREGASYERITHEEALSPRRRASATASPRWRRGRGALAFSPFSLASH